MEIFELRYFLGVAAFENIHSASEKLNVSPGSLSKAVKRLEEELSVKLFHRIGRNIELTDQGRLLQRRASAIVQAEEATRLEVSGASGTVQAVISGPEILLSKMGLSLCEAIRKRYPLSKFEFKAATDDEALEYVKNGEAHIALTTADISTKNDLFVKTLSEVKFYTLSRNQQQSA